MTTQHDRLETTDFPRGLTAFHLYVSCEVNAPCTVVTLPVCVYTVTFPRAFPSADEPFNTGSVSPNANNPSVSVSPYQRSLCSHVRLLRNLPHAHLFYFVILLPASISQAHPAVGGLICL